MPRLAIFCNSASGAPLQQERITRGSGLLEIFLARRRAEMANRLIPSVCRRGCIADTVCGRHPYFLLNAIFSRKIGLDKSIEEALTKSEQTPNITFIKHDVEQNPTILPTTCLQGCMYRLRNSAVSLRHRVTVVITSVYHLPSFHASDQVIGDINMRNAICDHGFGEDFFYF